MENELLKKKLEDQKEINKKLETNLNDKTNVETLIFLSNYYAELLLDKDKSKYKYNLEFNILRTSLFTYHQKDSKRVKEQLYLLMDIIEMDDVEKILEKIKTEKQEYIPLIIDYYKDLINVENNKIYGKSKLSYIKYLERKINEILNVKLSF